MVSACFHAQTASTSGFESEVEMFYSSSIQRFLHVLMRKQPTLLDSNQRWQCSIPSNIQRFLHVLMRKQPTLLDSAPEAQNVLFCLTKPLSHHDFLDSLHCRSCTPVSVASVSKQTPEHKPVAWPQLCHRREPATEETCSNAYALQASTVPSLQQGSTAQTM